MPSTLRRRAPIVAAVLVAIAIAAPLGAFASHQFADVPDSNPFHADIDAVADAGVTTGCGGSNYCPSAFVTREQMAAFMNRLGALSPSKTPVVNAAKLDGLDSSAFLPAGTITTQHAGTWVFDGVATIYAGNYETYVDADAAGTVYATLPLAGPVQIGAQQYALDTVEVCFSQAGGATIPELGAWAMNGAGTVDLTTSTPNAVVTGGSCLSLDDPEPSFTDLGITLWMPIEFASSAGFVSMATTRATWIPLP